MNLLINLLKGGPLNGWKTILGYVLANLFAGSPLALEAVNLALSVPTVANIANAIAHLVLAGGVVHQVAKKA
jgi:cytochrome bd-type quinol oxidase subunit 2